MVQESKDCSDVIKKYFNKEVLMTKNDNRDFKSSTKCWICDDDYFEDYVKKLRS